MVSSKELVKQAIEFKSPRRIPYNFDSNRTPAVDIKYGEDFVWLFVDTDSRFVSSIDNDEEYESEWGIVYQRLGKTSGEVKYSPLHDIENLKTYKFPDFSDFSRYHKMEEVINKNKDKYLMGMFPHFLFLHLLDLCGFENFMYQLIDSQSKVEQLIDTCMESCIKVVHCMADRGVDGIIAIEDLGIQDRLIISPLMWREIFKPRMKRIIDEAHKRGLHILLHSCGYIIDLIEDFIEIGLDVIQIDQQDNMGINRLAERYAGRICFFCPVDIQSTLPSGTPEEIEEKAKCLIKAFGSRDGGFMAKTYPQSEAINIPEKNTTIMCEAFKKFGNYPLIF